MPHNFFMTNIVWAACEDFNTLDWQQGEAARNSTQEGKEHERNLRVHQFCRDLFSPFPFPLKF